MVLESGKTSKIKALVDKVSGLPAVSSHDRGVRNLNGAFYKDTNPIHEDSPILPNHLPKAPLPNTLLLMIRFQHMNFGVRP
jgi:hypothetical protein